MTVMDHHDQSNLERFIWLMYPSCLFCLCISCNPLRKAKSGTQIGKEHRGRNRGRGHGGLLLPGLPLIFGTGIMDDCEPPCESWLLNLYPLQE